MSRHNRGRRDRRRAGKASQDAAPVVFQVDLHGGFALAMAGRLRDIVATRCQGCDTPLLAEGEGFTGAAALARRLGRPLKVVCAACCKRRMGLPQGVKLERSLPPDYRHEEDFAAALARLRDAARRPGE
jgi:hypothetical protein